MKKSREAFRTISEVADWLDVPTHVLRFWESRFAQIKPVKRAGGRRYYRPNDMALIGGIKVLLHDDGLTIRGVQKLLREQGVKHVAAHAPALPGDTDVADDPETTSAAPPPAPASEPAPVARATHDATPDPVVPDEEQVEMFPDTPQSPAPDLPSDPEDGAGDAHPPRVAARLWAMPAEDLAQHRETLRDVAERLMRVRDARSE